MSNPTPPDDGSGSFVVRDETECDLCHEMDQAVVVLRDMAGQDWDVCHGCMDALYAAAPDAPNADGTDDPPDGGVN